MKLANRIAPTRSNGNPAPDTDPRENASAEVIDLASRTAYPTVANRKGRSDAVGLAAGIGFVILIGGATLYGLSSSRVNEGSQGAGPVVQSGKMPESIVPDEAITPFLADEFEIGADPTPSPVLATPPEMINEPLDPYGSPTVIYDAGSVQGAETTIESGDDDIFDPGAGFEGVNVGGGPAVARTNVDPRTTVTQGTMIPAVLETAINTDVPGYARAVVSQDVRSFDGTRILVPRSSRLIGQYQSGLQAGQRRAYVIWTRLIRPDGVSVELASPASAFDGSGGLPGKVDSHFFQRFGSSILLSVIGGLTTIASGGTSVILGGGQDAASTALQQSGQISPTVRVRQGEPIRVFTARDLDFSQAPRL